MSNMSLTSNSTHCVRTFEYFSDNSCLTAHSELGDAVEYFRIDEIDICVPISPDGSITSWITAYESATFSVYGGDYSCTGTALFVFPLDDVTCVDAGGVYFIGSVDCVEPTASPTDSPTSNPTASPTNSVSSDTTNPTNSESSDTTNSESSDTTDTPNTSVIIGLIIGGVSLLIILALLFLRRISKKPKKSKKVVPQKKVQLKVKVTLPQ